MHPSDIMVLIGAACMVAFVSMMLSRESLRLYLAYIAAAILGTFAGGIAAQALIPIQPQFALIFGALAGGIACALAANRMVP